MPKIKVAIVDDHALFRRSLRCLLERDNSIGVVSEAGNGLEAIDLVEEFQPDVVLIDINMPLMNGVEATKVISSKYPGIKGIMLTMHTDDGVRVCSEESGASHFLSKDCNPKTLLTIIRNSSLSFSDPVGRT